MRCHKQVDPGGQRRVLWAVLASDRPYENTTWEKLNARRFELIEKRFDGGLTTLEAEELFRLQESVDRVLEPWDQQMLDQLAPIEQVARQIQSNE